MNKFKISYICRKKPDKWIHLDGFEKLGAKIVLRSGNVKMTAKKLVK